MTQKFDDFINQILTEGVITEAKRCKGPSLRQLSDLPQYRFMRCAPNPYSPGYKRIYWGRRTEKFDVRKCKKARPGTSKWEDCLDAKRYIIAAYKKRKKSRK